jgi:methylphosphotriester-DNA--protein-cysteine methyltransferase
MTKIFRLMGPQGQEYESPVKGQFGGNRRDRIYGRLDCPSALRALQGSGPYLSNRVFFADEAAAVAAGYRPCGTCMRDRYRAWKVSRKSGNP